MISFVFLCVYTICILVWNKLAKKVKYLGPTWQTENEIPRLVRNRITTCFFFFLFWNDLRRDEFINWGLGRWTMDHGPTQNKFLIKKGERESIMTHMENQWLVFYQIYNCFLSFRMVIGEYIIHRVFFWLLVNTLYIGFFFFFWLVCYTWIWWVLNSNDVISTNYFTTFLQNIDVANSY